MATISVDSASFDKVTRRPGVVLVDAWAEWCGPCRMFSPVFEAASQAHPDCVFAKLDTSREEALRDELGIEHIPTLMVYRDGLLLYHRPGSPPAEALEELIRQARALDMNEVRARRAPQNSATSQEIA